MTELWNRLSAAAPAQEPINMWTTPSRESDERQTPSMWEALMQRPLSSQSSPYDEPTPEKLATLD
jgi:hypothetical protein